MVNEKTKQDIQAKQYEFPYHYIPEPFESFKLSRHWAFAPSYIAAMKLVAEWLEPIAKKYGDNWRHIDIGCGDGALIYYLRLQLSAQEYQLEGVDLDQRAIGWARMFNPSTAFHLQDVAEIERRYHSASLIEVLEHIPPDNLDSFIAESMNILLPGGIALITVPSVEKTVPNKHFQHFSFSCIRSLFEPYLDDMEIYGFERRNVITRAISIARSNTIASIDSPVLNKITVWYLRQLHRSQKRCGRLLVIGTRNKKHVM